MLLDLRLLLEGAASTGSTGAPAGRTVSRDEIYDFYNRKRLQLSADEDALLSLYLADAIDLAALRDELKKLN